MVRGRQTRKLDLEQITQLKKFTTMPHDGHPSGYSLPALRTAMGAPFGFRVLGKALHGLPIWINAHQFITEWLYRYQKAADQLKDQKEQDDATREITRTIRGSR
jgi:hypothetical protein